MTTKQKCSPDAPRLSDLTGNTDIYHCAGCGFVREHVPRWQEHDHFDKPEMRVVCLCKRCAKRMVGPHPRLYRELELFEPMPGAMQVCIGCRWLERVACKCPLAKHNGGAGMVIMVPDSGVRGFVCSRGKGGGCHSFHGWAGHATSCNGKDYVK